jgi:hypothetical protein
VPPGDEPVRADDDRAVAGDLPVALPGAARIVVAAVEVADPQRVERDVRLGGVDRFFADLPDLGRRPGRPAQHLARVPARFSTTRTSCAC